MKTTLWVQISQRFLQEEVIEGETVIVEHETMEVKPFDGDSWGEAFEKATADYLATGAYFVANTNVLWFKMQIVNKLFAVEQNMTMEWTRPVVPASEETPESEG